MNQRILIVTPLLFELRAICATWQKYGAAGEPVAGKTEAIFVPELNVQIAVGGHGKARFAATTQYWIQHGPTPGAVLVAGAAGGLTDEVKIGDVVLGTETVEHDYKMRFGKTRPAPRHRGDGQLVDECFRNWQQRDIGERDSSGESSPTIHLVRGAIASGDEDIVDCDRRAQLREKTGALCVAWEGAGGFQAAALNDLPFLEMRAITDTADSSATGDFAKSIGLALGNLGHVLWEWRKVTTR